MSSEIHFNAEFLEHATLSNMQCVEWKQDCGDKWDFDFGLIRVSCRAYGSNAIYGAKHTCEPSILLNLHAHDHGGYLELARTYFEAESQTKLRVMVEEWVTDQVRIVIASILANLPIPQTDNNQDELRKFNERNQVHQNPA